MTGVLEHAVEVPLVPVNAKAQDPDLDAVRTLAAFLATQPEDALIMDVDEAMQLLAEAGLAEPGDREKLERACRVQ